MTDEQKHFTLKELKDKGHRLLAKVAKKREVHQNQVYLDLQKALGKTMEESAHFSNMHTIRDVEKAIHALEEMLEKGKRMDILPLSVQKKLIKPKEVRRPIYLWLPRLVWRKQVLFSVPVKNFL